MWIGYSSGMKWISKFICVVLVGVAVGCASTEQQGQNIPVPSSTPYDLDQFARTAYLDGFRRGYREQMSGGVPNVDVLNGPYPQAQRAGYYAGAAEAKASQAAAAKKKQ